VHAALWVQSSTQLMQLLLCLSSRFNFNAISHPRSGRTNGWVLQMGMAMGMQCPRT